MTKPQSYREQRTIAQETHYKVQEHFGKGPQAGSGVLTTGRVVWIEDAGQLRDAQGTVQAFAEGIGVVSLDKHSIRS